MAICTLALAADYWRRLSPQLQEGTSGRRALVDAIARAARLAATLLSPAR